MRRVLFLVILRMVLPIHAGFLHADGKSFARQRAAQITEIDYRLYFEFEERADGFVGNNRIGFRIIAAHEDLTLDFAGQTVLSAKLDGEPFPYFEFVPEREQIRIPGRFLSAGRHELELDFTAAYTKGDAGLHRYIDPDDNREYLYSDLQPDYAHHLFPCFDQPNLRASYRLDLCIPSHWEAVANAPLRHARLQGTHRLLEFAATKPIAPYLFNLVLGPYAMWRDNFRNLPLKILCRQSMAKYLDADTLFSTTKRGLAFFSEYFDEPYPFEKYDQTFVPEYNVAAMENPGSVIINDLLILGYGPAREDVLSRDQVIFHEMAHMWFGNLVTLDWWDDLWLNESFASLMELIALEGLGYEETRRITIAEKIPAYEADLKSNTRPIIEEVPDTRTAATMFDAIIYSKGLAVLRQLSFHLGAEVFRDGIRHYMNRHAWSNTKLEDYRRAMEEVSGVDLGEWFQKWLTTAGLNTLRLEWKSKGGRITKARVVQETGNGNAVLRPHNLVVGLFYADAQGLAVMAKAVPVYLEGPRLNLTSLKGQPEPLFIQMNLHERDHVKTVYDKRSRAWLLQHIHTIKDEVFRFQAWETLWQNVREGSLAATDYFDLAMFQIELPAPLEIDQGLLEKMLEILQLYLPDTPQARNLRHRLFLTAQTALVEAELEHHRHSWFQLLLDTAEYPSDFAYLRDLLAGTETISGYALGSFEKWLLFLVLTDAGTSPEAEVLEKLCGQSEPELRELFLPIVRARNPDLESKRRVWAKITTDDSLSLAHKKRLMRHFYSHRQQGLIPPFVDAYFDVLETSFHQGNRNFTAAFAKLMFPMLGRRQTMAAARIFLKRPDLPRPLRKMVGDQTAELERILAVRAANDEGVSTGR